MRFPVHVLAVAALAFALGACDQSHAKLGNAGTEFQDCPECPVMVVLPQQSFVMGSPETEGGRSKNEGPQRTVTIAYPVAVGKFEVTFAQWEACVAANACRDRREALAHPREGDDRPMVHVNWFDAKAYADWLKLKTGRNYRLLTEAEWEYAARGGATTTYSWGEDASHEHANYGSDECCNGAAIGRDQWQITSPVGSFPANGFGVHDFLGNVWEWIDECYNEDPSTSPIDGSSHQPAQCEYKMMRGGSWASLPVRIRPAYRDAYHPADQGEIIGFRVARGE